MDHALAIHLPDPRLTKPATSATRLPRSRASASSFSSMPGESVPVDALAPNPPPPLPIIIWLMNIAAKMVSMVTSFPLETDAPVAKAHVQRRPHLPRAATRRDQN